MVDSIRELLVTEPFHPFRIRASSGTAYEVRNPGLVVILKSQVLVAEPNSDRYSLVPFLHVAGVDMIDGRSGRNKRSSRR